MFFIEKKKNREKTTFFFLIYISKCIPLKYITRLLFYMAINAF